MVMYVEFVKIIMITIKWKISPLFWFVGSYKFEYKERKRKEEENKIVQNVAIFNKSFKAIELMRYKKKSKNERLQMILTAKV